MVGVMGGLNAEKAMPPPWIVREPYILDDEILLSRLPFDLPRKVRLLQDLAESGVLHPVSRWKQDHRDRFELPYHVRCPSR
jgi:hypothetical protein